MTFTPQQLQLLLSSLVLTLLLWGFVGVWTLVGVRLWRRQAVLPCQPRRPVPWHGIDLLLVLACSIVLSAAAQQAILAILRPEMTRPPRIFNAEEASPAHVIARLLESAGPWGILACVVAAGVVAPIAEEFLFRVLLQGWLETVERRLWPQMPALRRWLPRAALPIVLTSLLFGMMHFRVAAPPEHPIYMLAKLIGVSVVSLLTMLFAVVWLRGRVGATAADLGWAPERFWPDVRLGLTAFAGLAGPVYGLQAAAGWLLPKQVAPDPVTLFFFALALGTLYFRTHRIVPAITLHMSLNVASLTMALLTLKVFQ